MSIPFGRRVTVLSMLFVLALAVGLSADRGFVTNRGGSTVSVFDTTTNTEVAGSPVSVGGGPIAIVADAPPTSSPTKLWVACPGSASVTAFWNSSLNVAATITSDGIFGNLDMPSGIAFASDSVVGPMIVVVDQKATTYTYVGTQSGRSTVRFIDPATNQIVDALQEPSATARYNDVVYTSNAATGRRRLWIADDGDGGVTVIKLDASTGPPFYFNRVITYQGSAEYADFVADTSAAPTFLKAPRRLATNGTTRVVAADAGSKVVTILNGNYASTNVLGEPGAILANVDLSTWAGPGPLPAASFTCVDVKIVGNFAYVSTSNVGPAANLYQIDLTTFAITGTVSVAGASGVQGLGATSDGAFLYAGSGSGSGTISKFDLNPSTDFTAVPPVTVGPFTGGSFPFGFAFAATVNSGGAGSGGTPIWSSTSTTSSSSRHGCGLMGLEAALLLLAMRRLRRNKA